MSHRIFLFLVLIASLAMAMPNPSATLCVHSGYEYAVANSTCSGTVGGEFVECDGWDYYDKCYGSGGECALECPEEEPDWTGGDGPQMPVNDSAPANASELSNWTSETGNATSGEDYLLDVYPPEESDKTGDYVMIAGIILALVIVGVFLLRSKKKTNDVNLDELGELE